MSQGRFGAVKDQEAVVQAIREAMDYFGMLLTANNLVATQHLIAWAPAPWNVAPLDDLIVRANKDGKTDFADLLQSYQDDAAACSSLWQKIICAAHKITSAHLGKLVDAAETVAQYEDGGFLSGVAISARPVGGRGHERRTDGGGA